MCWKLPPCCPPLYTIPLIRNESWAKGRPTRRPLGCQKPPDGTSPSHTSPLWMLIRCGRMTPLNHRTRVLQYSQPNTVFAMYMDMLNTKSQFSLICWLFDRTALVGSRQSIDRTAATSIAMDSTARRYGWIICLQIKDERNCWAVYMANVSDHAAQQYGVFPGHHGALSFTLYPYIYIYPFIEKSLVQTISSKINH